MKKYFIPVFALFACSALAFGDTKKSFKRGFGENTLYYVEDLQALMPGNSWYYDWGNEPSAQVADHVGSEKGIEFIPQAWSSYDETKLRAYYKAHPNDRYLLGFNEPNFPDQAAMLPSEAAEKWHSLEALAKELNLILVGPAMNYAGKPLKDGKVWNPFDWMDAFIAAYKEKYGTEPHYDYTAVHAYMDRADAMMDFVDKFYEKYGKKVWLTEFCAWEDANITAEKQQEYMIGKLKVLENSDHVYRYAWFKARNANKYPYYNLLYYPTKTIKAGTLTELGFAYVHMSTFDKDKFYAIGEPIPANDFIDCNLTKLQESADPRARVKEMDKTELMLNKSNLSATYQIDVPKGGTYKLILRYAYATDNLKAKMSVVDADGNTLVNKAELAPTGAENKYAAAIYDVALKAGKQKLTIKKANFQAVALSLVKLVETVNPNDADTQTLTGDKLVKPGDNTGGDTPDTPVTPGENESFDKEVVISDDTYKFDSADKYYAIYLDGTTQSKNIPAAQLVNIGDNGTSQNSYLWEGTFNYGDATGKNSFGVEGEYKAIVSSDKGWSGMGYNIDGSKGDLDLSAINDDYKLHIALKADHNNPIKFTLNDGKHNAALVFGQYDLDGIDPVANFKRDGKWHNIDIPMSYLHRKFGLDYRDAKDYNGNILVISVGGEKGVKVDFDAVFFYGPKDSKPNTGTLEGLSNAEATVSDDRFQFSDDERYYIVYLDDATRGRNLDASQTVDCGPNGGTQQLYPWDGTCRFNTNADNNSFGEPGAYMSATQVADWFGMGYNVAGGLKPLNLSGLSNDYFLHMAVRSEYTGPILFTVTDAAGKSGNIVLGKEAYHDHQPLADFARDGKWHNVEIPMRLLNLNDGVNFTRSTNYTGNIFSILMNGEKGKSTIDFDAVFFHGPKSAPAYETEKPTDKAFTVKKADENPFTFSADEDYYIITLDSDTKRENLTSGQIVDCGPNESTRFLYPWSDTVTPSAATGKNSFGVEGNYSAWTVGNQGWSGLGFFVNRNSLLDLSGITKDYSLHFAVKSTTTQPIDFEVVDGNGKEAHFVLGKEAYGSNAAVADFERDDTWYNVDIPMSWFIKKGLDFRTAKAFGGNLFCVMCGTKQGDKADYDTVFFHGPKKQATGINGVTIGGNDSTNPRDSYAVFDLSGRQVPGMTEPGMYIVRTKDGVKKIVKR